MACKWDPFDNPAAECIEAERITSLDQLRRYVVTGFVDPEPEPAREDEARAYEPPQERS
jgi:hypothetical protein